MQPSTGDRPLSQAFKKALPFVVFVFLAFAVLYPNPYGNNPDVIGDESYFLTSALTAIQHVSLPGWVWSPSTTYYGGIQTYADTAALIPVLGIAVVFSHFSLTAAKVWAALNTGLLLHVLRLVNGAAALGAILFCFLFFGKRGIPRQLGLTLTLFFFFIVSDALVIQFLHTAKMWDFYIVFVSVTGAFFIVQEYYLRHLSRPFLERDHYVALLVWSGVLTFFQSYVGAISIFVLMLYALFLRHIDVRDVWNYFKKVWYLIVLVAVTQISFLYQFYRISSQFSGVSTMTPTGTINWFDRFVAPLGFAIQGQPLVILYAIGILAIIALALSGRSPLVERPRRRYLLIACIHPILVYLIFYIGLGFDLLPRYGVILTLACTFSATILMSEIGAKAMKGALACAVMLFLLVGVHAIALYWKPSSETVLLQTIEATYDTSKNVFITDHSARHLTLPVNVASLPLLDQQREDMGRFSFLLQNQDLLSQNVTFKPITAIAYTDQEESADIALFATTTDSIWIISSDCSDLCSAAETNSGTCFEINTDACALQPQEVNALPVFLSSPQLGFSYIVRRVH